MWARAWIGGAAALVVAATLVPAQAGADQPPDAKIQRLAISKALVRSGAVSSSEAQAETQPISAETALARQLSPRAQIHALSSDERPGTVIFGLKSGADLEQFAIQARSTGLAQQVRLLRPIDAVAVRTTQVDRLVQAVGSRSDVAYAERSQRRETKALDPYDGVDPRTGVSYNWAYDAVAAGPALAAVGGGSRFKIGIIDTGLDMTHPDIAGRAANSYDALRGAEGQVSDAIGHGTFVAGLISMIDGNGIGARGVAGTTPILPVQATDDGSFITEDILSGATWAQRKGARILNLSLGGESFSRSEARAFDRAYFSDVLPIASSGNEAKKGNPVSYPAAYIGGTNGSWGIGLSVGASRPDGTIADFSTHNEYVSLTAPGAGQSGCKRGVFSTIPVARKSAWDDADTCSLVFGQVGDKAGRYAYGEGTSFSTPIVAGLAALVLQANPQLHSEQVGRIMQLSAKQPDGSVGWNEFTGYGNVNGGAAVELAKRFDTEAPTFSASVRRGRSSVLIRTLAHEVTAAGRTPASGISIAIRYSRNGGGFRSLKSSQRKSLTSRVRLSPGRYSFEIGVCDSNLNCTAKRFGPMRVN